jgi:hypothetical protein
MATNNAINLTGNGVVGYDGAGTFITNASTQYAVHTGGATASSITQLAVGTNGQVLLGATGAAPAFATLTGTGGITFTLGANALAINSTAGGVNWVIITADQTAAINTSYICNKAGLLTLTMPGTAAVGSVIGIMNMNTAVGAKFLSANPGQLYLGTSAATANTGSLTSINLGDAMFLVCIVADTTWRAYAAQGNWTVA